MQQASRIRSRGRLPHWEERAGIYFVTFRLADSLPRSALRGILECKRSDNRKLSRTKQLEQYLDNGSGKCFLARPKLSQLVTSSLRAYDGQRYRLFAWCVMPNHVHVVVQPKEPFTLSSILHTWKSYSGQMANRLLKRKGHFWQREYYDHLIRNGEELARAIAYTADNPQKAGLREWKWVYVSKNWN